MGLSKRVLFFFGIILVIVFFILGFIIFPHITARSYVNESSLIATVATSTTTESNVVVHQKTPSSVKGLYMTSWVAGKPELRKSIISLAQNTEINTIVIDVKDYTGRVSFEVVDPKLKEVGSQEIRIADIREFIQTLHEKHIYVIGRIAVFQDPYFVTIHPEFAVKKKSDGSIWKDYKGVTWLDPAAKDVWEYIARLGKEAHSAGFDEINFDYIRFPSDGDMKDIAFPFSKDRKKEDVLKDFFAYLHTEFSQAGIPISADVFGMTTTNKDDLNIGQVLEDTLLNFDYVMPMVYPSHFPATWGGFKNPAAAPHDVVKLAMTAAALRAKAAGISEFKLRPWLQDFNLGAVYTKDMVRAQIAATYDSGLNSWVLWDAGNTYTKAALLKKGESTMKTEATSTPPTE